MTPDAIAQFWQAYLDTLPPDAPHRQIRYVAEAFGDNPALADELGVLIHQGRKTATCSALWEWEAEGATIPQPGLITRCASPTGTRARPSCKAGAMPAARLGPASPVGLPTSKSIWRPGKRREPGAPMLS